MAAPVGLTQLLATLAGGHVALFGESIASSMTYPTIGSLSPQHGDALRWVLGQNFGLIGTGIAPARGPQGYTAAPGTAPAWLQEKRPEGNFSTNQMNDAEHIPQWIYNSAQAANGFGILAGVPDANSNIREAGWVFAGEDLSDDPDYETEQTPLLDLVENLFALSGEDYREFDSVDVYYSRNGSGSNNVTLEFYGYNGATRTNTSNYSLITSVVVPPNTAMTRINVTLPTGFKRGILVSPDNRGATPDAQQGGWSVQFARGIKARPAGAERRVEISIGASYGGQEIATATAENESAGDRTVHDAALALLAANVDLAVPIFHQNDSNVTSIAAYKASHKSLATKLRAGNANLKMLYLSPTIRNGVNATWEQWYYDARDALREAAVEDGDYFIDLTSAWGVNNSFQPDAHLNQAGYERLISHLTQQLGFGANNFWRHALTQGQF